MMSRKLFWQTKLSTEIKILYIELESFRAVRVEINSFMDKHLLHILVIRIL